MNKDIKCGCGVIDLLRNKFNIDSDIPFLLCKYIEIHGLQFSDVFNSVDKLIELLNEITGLRVIVLKDFVNGAVLSEFKKLCNLIYIYGCYRTVVL